MTRFLMTLDDSVDLVLSSLRNAKTGDIFVQKTSACRIIDLAEAIREYFGKPKSSIEVIGTRHGEKT